MKRCRAGGKKKRRLGHGGELSGSLTIEASFLVPMILFCMAAVMITGLEQSGRLAQEARSQKEEWIEAQENAPEFPLILRGGSEAQEWIGRIRGGE